MDTATKISRREKRAFGTQKSCRNELLGMEPKQFRSGGGGVTIQFALGQCSLGSILVAGSERGICCIMLGDDPNVLLQDLQHRFRKARLIGGNKAFEQQVGRVIAFVEYPTKKWNLPLDIQGTAFQQRVWEKLSKIPLGETRNYSQIAALVGAPQATRAVAQACAANPIAVAIPCHRVVRLDGSLSGYRWGIERKAELLKREVQI